MNDLVSVVLSLKALPAPERAPQDGLHWWGRAAQALLLDVVAGVDAALAEDLHDGPHPGALPQEEGGSSNSIRPYTVSSLMGRFVKGQVLPDGVYVLRLTAFRADVADALLTATQARGRLAAGELVELDYLPFRVEMIQPGESPDSPSPWACVTSFQELSSPFLLSKEPAPRRLTLQLTSPTTFKSGGKHVPLPLPGLVFGSLLERWNAFAPVAFPAEARRFAEECLAVSQFDLKTVPVPQKGGGLRVGALGSIRFTALNYDRYWMSVLATLAQFSLFCGLGAGTAQGLGQCRLMIGD